MKFIIAIFFLIMCKASAQTNRIFFDTTTKQHQQKFNGEILASDFRSSFIRFPDDSIIVNDIQFQEFSKQFNFNPTKKPDLSSSIIWLLTCFNDCHASYNFESILDTLDKTYTLREIEKYGGCRGMGIKEFVILFPKIPVGYLVKKERIHLEQDGTLRRL